MSTTLKILQILSCHKNFSEFMAVMKICKSDAHHFVPGFQQSKGHSFKRDKRGPAAQRADHESKPFSYIQRRPVYITNILMYFCI